MTIKRFSMIFALVLGMSSNAACSQTREFPPPARENFEEDVAQLAEAACEGDAEEVDRLVALGVDVNAVGTEDVTPLKFAIACKSAQGVQALISNGVELDQEFTRDRSLAGAATITGSTEIIAVLMDAGMNFSGEEGASQDTPLVEAVRVGVTNGNWEPFYFLLDRGVDPEVRAGPFQNSVAITAGAYNQYDKVLELLMRGYSRDLVDLRTRVSLGQVDPTSHQSQAQLEVLQFIDDLLAGAEG